MLLCCVYLTSVTLCIVAKRCVIEHWIVQCFTSPNVVCTIEMTLLVRVGLRIRNSVVVTLTQKKVIL